MAFMSRNSYITVFSISLHPLIICSLYCVYVLEKMLRFFFKNHLFLLMYALGLLSHSLYVYGALVLYLFPTSSHALECRSVQLGRACGGHPNCTAHFLPEKLQ